MKKHGISFFSVYRFALVYLLLYLESYGIFRYALRTGMPWLASLTAILMTALLLYSLSRLLIRFELRAWLYEGEKTKKEKVRFLLHRKKTQITFLIFLFLPFSLELISALFGNLAPALLYLLSRIVLLPVFLLSYLLGSLSGLKKREIDAKKKERAPFFFPLHTLKYALPYFLGGMMLPYLIVVCFSLPGITLMLLTSSLGGALVIIFGALWLIRILRAISVRREFLEKLQDACHTASIPFPDIKRPILSLFRGSKGTRFTIVAGEEVYECKLLGTFRPNMIHRFYSNGEGARVHVFVFRPFMLRTTFIRNLKQERHELWETRFHYGFETEKGIKKILIFNPCSKIVDGNQEGRGFSLDNGLLVGEYRFFTASGFCNAIARDCIERQS